MGASRRERQLRSFGSLRSLRMTNDKEKDWLRMTTMKRDQRLSMAIV